MNKTIGIVSVLTVSAVLLTINGEAKPDKSNGNNYSNNASESSQQLSPSSQSRINKDRLAIGRALIEVQATNWPKIMPFYTDDIEYHDAIVDIYGKPTMTAFLAQLFGSSPDLVTTIEDETCVNGIYTATWTMVGQFSGVPFDAPGMSIIKFRPGELQAYYQRDYYTEGDIMANIPGLDQAVEGFRTFYKCAVDPTFPCPTETP